MVDIDPIKNRDYTFGQLRGLSQTFAANLQAQLQWNTGDCLAIFSPNCPEYIIAVLGGAACGATISPASAGFSLEELTYQFENCGATALITHASLLETTLKAAETCKISKQKVFVIANATSSTTPAGLTSFEAFLTKTGKSEFVAPKIAVKKDLVALPYSSGTTGRPKGVKLSHFNIVSNVLSCIVSLADGTLDNPPSDDAFISILPFSHIYGRDRHLRTLSFANVSPGLTVLVLVAVMTGRTQIILSRFDLITYLELVQKHKCNMGYIVPPVLTAFAKHPVIAKYNLSSFRKGGLMCAAAPLSVQLTDAVYNRLQIPIYQAFGMTEASPATHILTVANWKQGKGGVGPLVPNVQARLVGDDGNDVKPGEWGELWVRGPNIFVGYHNNDAATADCMTADGFYKSGDIARVDPETGHFYITDRVKELIKYKGFQVPSAELEGVLSAHPQIADVAVVGIWNEEAQTEAPRAYVVLHTGWQFGE